MFKHGKYVYSVLVIITLATVLVAITISYSSFINKKGVPQKNGSFLSCGTLLEKSEDFGQEYIDKIIFLGESTTYGLQKYAVLSDGLDTKQVWTGATISNNQAVSSGTLSLSPSIADTRIFFPDTKQAVTIGEAVKLKNPEYLIITLGLNNGASYYTEEKFKSCYRILIDSVKCSSGSTKIILQSLFPVASYCGINAYTPSRISECNKWIYELAEEYDIKYLNTFEVLADENGYMKIEYDNGGDGIHLNAIGLKAVLEYIKSHGYRED